MGAGGRPPIADKRRPRVRFNDREWAIVAVEASRHGRCAACGISVAPGSAAPSACCAADIRPMSAAAWVRMMCGL